MSDPIQTTVSGFDFHGQWKSFYVPLPVKVEQDIDYGYRAYSSDPFSFGTGPTPDVAIAALKVHLGKQYNEARWAAEMVD